MWPGRTCRTSSESSAIWKTFGQNSLREQHLKWIQTEDGTTATKALPTAPTVSNSHPRLVAYLHTFIWIWLKLVFWCVLGGWKEQVVWGLPTLVSPFNIQQCAEAQVRWQDLDRLNNDLSTYINLYQLISTISTYINLYQLISTYIDLYQHKSTYINLYQLISTYIDLYQLISTYINLYQLISTYIDLY
jgi:hypothetical protein